MEVTLIVLGRDGLCQYLHSTYRREWKTNSWKKD